MNSPTATISSITAECSIGYTCHSTGQPPARNASRERSAHASCTTRIVRAVRHEHRHVAIRRTRLRHHAIRADQVRRQSDQSAEALGVTNARVQRDRPALRKSGEEHAPRCDAPRRLARDERLDMRLRAPHAVDVGALVEVRLPDVVPRAHPHAVVDRHGNDGRMREDETDGERLRQVQRGHDLRPSLAVVAQSVHPDDATHPARRRFRFRWRREDRLACAGVEWQSGILADAAIARASRGKLASLSRAARRAPADSRSCRPGVRRARCARNRRGRCSDSSRRHRRGGDVQLAVEPDVEAFAYPEAQDRRRRHVERRARDAVHREHAAAPARTERVVTQLEPVDTALQPAGHRTRPGCRCRRDRRSTAYPPRAKSAMPASGSPSANTTPSSSRRA